VDQHQPRTFADVINIEDAQVKSGTAAGCGHTCPGCHGGLTCIRTSHGDDQAHVGRDANGQLVQWHTVGCDEEAHAAAQAQHAAMVADAKAQQTTADQVEELREYLAGVDPDVLRAFLDGAAR
jgi:hypothetical protein